jgi:hypothetical protein
MHVHVQGLVLVVNIATMLEEYTTKEQRSFVLFFVAKRFSAKDVYKEMLPVYGGKCLSCKAVHNWVKKHCKCFTDDEEVETEVRKWLR